MLRKMATRFASIYIEGEENREMMVEATMSLYEEYMAKWNVN